MTIKLWRFLTLLGMISLVAFSCKNNTKNVAKANANTEIVEDEEDEEMEDDEEDLEDAEDTEYEEDPMTISEYGFMGMTPGDEINTASKNLRKAIQKNGEGDFVGYELLDDKGKVIGFLFPDEEGESVIDMIEVNVKGYTTQENIGVGSTYKDLKSAYPDIEVHGSEVESETSVEVGGLLFILDAYFNTYEVDESKIAPTTKVKQIFIRG